MSEDFVADLEVQQIAEANALGLVSLSLVPSSKVPSKFDWSDSSIAHVEVNLGSLYAEMENAPDEQVSDVATAFACYIGEVFRRNHGATWGAVTIEGESWPGLKAADRSDICCFHKRVYDRLRKGSAHNVWHYYQELVQRSSAIPTDAPRPPTNSCGVVDASNFG